MAAMTAEAAVSHCDLPVSVCKHAHGMRGLGKCSSRGAWPNRCVSDSQFAQASLFSACMGLRRCRRRFNRSSFQEVRADKLCDMLHKHAFTSFVRLQREMEEMYGASRERHAGLAGQLDR